MGGLIQTKGTQYLANFFNTLFSGANLATTLRGAGFASLVSDFSKPYAVSSLYFLSEKYRGKWTDSSDVFYPACSITGFASVGGSLKSTHYRERSGFYYEHNQRWSGHASGLLRNPRSQQHQHSYTRYGHGKCNHCSVGYTRRYRRSKYRAFGFHRYQSGKSTETVEILPAI